LNKRGVVSALIKQTQKCADLSENTVDLVQIISLCVWALGNFVVGSEEIRNKVLKEGVLARLSHLFEALPGETDFRTEIVFFIHNCFCAIPGKFGGVVLPPLN
jgi:hypothetical protein